MRVLRTSSSRPRRFVQPRPLVVQPPRWSGSGSSDKPKLLGKRSRPRRIASLVLLAIGGALCTFVAGSYAWMYAEQKELLHQWKTEKAAKEAFTKLSIPNIGLSAVVLEGASRHSLLLGPVHLTGTAAPGSLGNAVIAGHRDTFFRHVHNLKKGNDIYVQRSGKQFHYVVVQKKIVEATDLSVLNGSQDGELTLITCYPTNAIGPAPKRLIVVAKLSKGPTPNLPSRMAAGLLFH